MPLSLQLFCFHSSVPKLYSELWKTVLPLWFAHWVWTAEHPENICNSCLLVLMFLFLCSFPAPLKKKRPPLVYFCINIQSIKVFTESNQAVKQGSETLCRTFVVVYSISTKATKAYWGGVNIKLLQFSMGNRHHLAVLQSKTISILDKAPFRNTFKKINLLKFGFFLSFRPDYHTLQTDYRNVFYI